MSDKLNIWTVYKRPKDYPDKFVARAFSVTAVGPVPTPAVLVADTLQEIREQLPIGLHCIPRYPQDDPNIVEVWL